jgi:4-hydroxybenzoate polyprenyltransferase
MPLHSSSGNLPGETPLKATGIPLVVDLDGTLLATDTLWEMLLVYLRDKPWCIFSLFAWVVSGKARFKEKLASVTVLDVGSLPYRADCLDWLLSEKQSGRTIFLATGANVRVANAVAEHLKIFDGVIASDSGTNVTGLAKADRIATILGTESYDYAGNSHVDIAIWRKSLSAIVVAPDSGVISSLERQNIPVKRHIPAARVTVRTWVKALRVHQWIKNLLVFTPLLTSHRILDLAALGHALCGFVVFSLVASSTYLVNDLLDLPADRRHPTKSKRPMAAGLISIPAAMSTALLLLVLASLLSSLLPWQAAILVLGYSMATLLYSLVIKKMLVADVVTLAVFYTARLLYGGLATGIEISIWTLAFCAFSFFSLAAAKRINDLAKASLRESESLKHRAYQWQDRNALVASAASTSNVAVLVLILYINSQQGERLYRHPQWLWIICIPLLYWFNRILTLANRGSLADDPILFAAKDTATYVVLACVALIAFLAT